MYECMNVWQGGGGSATERTNEPAQTFQLTHSHSLSLSSTHSLTVKSNRWFGSFGRLVVRSFVRLIARFTVYYSWFTVTVSEWL